MFHKFSVKPAEARGSTKISKVSGMPQRRDEMSARTATKRRKISKACDRCRLQRIKCDEQKPCTRCIASGAKCTVPYALHEAVEAHTIDIDIGDVGNESLVSSDTVQVPSILSPLAAAAIVAEIPLHFDISLESSGLASDIQQFFASAFAAEAPASCAVGSLFPQLPSTVIPAEQVVFAPELFEREQRRRYLRIFWDNYHPLLQMISELEFVELEAAPPPATPEEYSVENALVDAFIALGVQHVHTTGLVMRLSHFGQKGSIGPNECDLSGFKHFHRCRELMRTIKEVTLQSLRCHVSMVLYLMRGCALHDAYNLLGITVRKAYVAELHRPPSSHLPENEKSSRLQLWWLIFSLDLQCSLQLQMPAACQKSLVKCSLPTVDALVRCSSPRAYYRDGLTACTYSILMVNLAVVLSDIGASVSTADLFDDSSDDPDVLEQLALKLAPALQGLEAWKAQIPISLMLHNASENSNSFDLGEDSVQPTWLQRQRILLQLQYHNAYVLVLRPFVSLCFASFSDDWTGTLTTGTEQSYVQRHISSSISHANAIVDIVSTLSSTSDVLHGWFEVLQPLWNAATVITAYIYANSLNPSVSLVVQSLTHADTAFECFSAASDSIRLARDIFRRLVQSLQSLQSLSI